VIVEWVAVVMVLVLRSIIDTLGHGGDGDCGDFCSSSDGNRAPGRKSAT